MGGAITQTQLALVVSLFFTSFFRPSVGEAEPLVIRVCSACEVQSVKEAVLKVASGGEVLIEDGTYKEYGIIVGKPLKIAAIHQGKVIIDGQDLGDILVLNSQGVEVEGLVIKNSGFSHTEERAGIKVLQSSNCRIKNNILQNNSFGIYLAESSSCLISNNHVTGTHLSESRSGNGIHIWKSDKIKVFENTVTGNRDGIYFEFVQNSSILKNQSYKNIRYGLHFMFSHNNDYRENTFRENDCGVAVMYSRNIQMIRNHFEDSVGPISYGILLKDISDSSISANTFQGNTVAVFIEGTTRTHFEGNLFKKNGWALRILGSTDSNVFTRNDFIDNTFDIRTNANSNLNQFFENYWSHYRGLDLNRDGYGDDIYRPVKLTSMLIEEYGVAVLLLQSMFFTILDQVENYLPVLTPETFKDEKVLIERATSL